MISHGLQSAGGYHAEILSPQKQKVLQDNQPNCVYNNDKQFHAKGPATPEAYNMYVWNKKNRSVPICAQRESYHVFCVWEDGGVHASVKNNILSP
jgi:hypothetical protein